MALALGVNRKAASLPSVGHLSQALGAHAATEVLGGYQDKASQPCFSPVFDLELDAKQGGSNHFDRCFSHQQLQGEDAGGSSGSLLQQILALCRCGSPIQAQLLQQLQRLRSSAYATNGATGLLAGGSGHSDEDASACILTSADPAAAAAAVVGRSASVIAEERVDIEAMACELLALGYMVQVRDGAQQQERGKTPRSCLQNLRHRFIVCLGVRSAADGEPAYLPEPLVVEPCFREQFTIAHPTPEYEALLQSVPPCFVGPVANLEGVVKLICEQMMVTFKLQGLPVPPWRTRAALLSKWSPPQLAELAAKISGLRRIAACLPAASRAIVPCQSHERLYNGDRPAAAHADHAAVGSAPLSATHAHTALHGAGAGAGPWAQHRQQQQQTPTPVSGGPGGLKHAAGVAPPASGWPAVLHASKAGGSTALQQDQQQFLPQQQQQQAQVAAGAVESSSGGLGGLQQPAATAAMGPGVQQPSAADHGVLGLLSGNSNTDAAGGGAVLKFTRKASAEWKHQRNNSRKIKGLLAAALKKSRNNLLAMASGSSNNSSAEQAAAASHHHNGPVGSSSSSSTAGPQRGAGGSGAPGDAHHHHHQQPAAGPSPGSGSDALIRRTHFRAACDEPWRRITTVRLGAYAPAPPQQHQQQQRPGLQHQQLQAPAVLP